MSTQSKWTSLKSILAQEHDKERGEKVKTPPQPSPSITDHPPPSPTQIAPSRDYNKRANSIERDALPSGSFPGASKKIYDAVYLRTRGAVQPKLEVKATKRELMEWSGIRNVKTIETHVRHLVAVGLMTKRGENGDAAGFFYSVQIPSPTNPNQHGWGPTPTIADRKTVVEGGRKTVMGGEGYLVGYEEATTQPKTSLKTTTIDDESNPFADLTKTLAVAIREITGADPAVTPEERERWRELGEMLVCELRAAAAHSKRPVSSVPAFLAAHLRRRFTQRPPHQREGKPKPIVETAQHSAQDPNRRLTPEEITSYAATVMDLLKDGTTLEEVTAQFAGSLHPEDWIAIQRAATSQSK